MKIGIFDSGIGGLSVLHEAYHLLPDQEYIFYADVEHVPYGLKTPEQILGYAVEITEFLISQGAEAIVVACNTATSVAIKELRNRYDIPILGMEPAVKPAVEGTEGKRIMVMATPVTIREDKLKDLLHRVDGEHRVDLLAMPGFVEFAEKEKFDGPEVTQYVEKQLSGYNKDEYCALVLGCTHFNYFKPALRAYFGDNTLLIDGNKGTVNHLADVLELEISQHKEDVIDSKHNILCLRNTKYFFSGKEVVDEETCNRLLRLHLRLEEVRNI
ncbi:MAG: glutamate racemase [Butyrivibrio sp.]|nr:glutamate racemase [Butyrivibrio sp.]